jgi:hypothetical protein
LWLRSNRFTVQHASVLNAFSGSELKHSAGVSNREWLVFDGNL